MALPSMMLVVGIVALSLSCLSKIEGCFRDSLTNELNTSGRAVKTAALEPNTLYPVVQGLNEACCQIKNELGGQLSIS